MVRVYGRQRLGTPKIVFSSTLTSVDWNSRRGLVDRYEVVVRPVILGGGTPYLPPLETRIRLRLSDTRAFDSGVTYMGYDVE